MQSKLVSSRQTCGCKTRQTLLSRSAGYIIYCSYLLSSDITGNALTYMTSTNLELAKRKGFLRFPPPTRRVCLLRVYGTNKWSYIIKKSCAAKFLASHQIAGFMYNKHYMLVIAQLCERGLEMQ